MPRYLTGGFEGLEVAGEELTVTGLVEGARIAGGSALEVVGAFNGDLDIEEGGVLSVTGTFTPGAVSNQGIILVGGLAMLQRADRRRIGYFAISPGSTINGETIVMPDGTERPVTPPHETLDPDGEAFCVWIEEENRFIPQDELQAITRARESAE